MRPSGAPRAPTRGTRFVPDLSDEAPNLGLRIADLERQLLEQKDAAEEARAAERNAKARRQGEANRASKLEEEKKTLEVAVEKLQKQLAEGPTRKKKAVNSAQTFSDRVTELSKHVKRLYELDDLPRLFVDCLRRLSKGRTDLRPLLRKAPGFEAVLREIHLERDRSTAEHLRRNVYNKEAFALMRLVVGLSKRECALIQQAFKYRRSKQGRRTRCMLNADSAVGAPELLFDLAGIIAMETQAQERSQIRLGEQADRKCAYVAGPFGVDQAIVNSIEATKSDRTGGMVTCGSCEEQDHVHEDGRRCDCQDWIVNFTGDGALLTQGSSGVRFSEFPGNTELLNQSSNDVTDLVMYQEQSNAEHYLVLKGRLAEIRPALARLYRKGELRPRGERSGKHIKICLLADKPFLRHVCGLTSHNADAFGGPFCSCCDKDLYNFSFDKRTHYGSVSYEQLCNRAHVPLWQALCEPEPEQWSFTCDCCNQVFFYQPRGNLCPAHKLTSHSPRFPEFREPPPPALDESHHNGRPGTRCCPLSTLTATRSPLTRTGTITGV